MVDGKVTYHQQVTFCGKPRCRKCREGIGHGPYWYAYRTVDGQTTRTYIGKNLPPGVEETGQATTIHPQKTNSEPAKSGSSMSPGTRQASTNSQPDAPLLRILTLGQFRLERRDASSTSQKNPTWQPVSDTIWQQRQESSVRTLLAYLICSPQRRVARSQLLGSLWHSLDTETANRRLNKTIQQLQKILGSISRDTGVLSVQSDGEWLQLADQDALFIDADDFEARLTRLNQDNPPANAQQEQHLRDALALYNGDFLPEERDAEWVITRRHALRRGWSELLLTLADHLLTRQGFSEAITVLNRLLAKDPTNELAVQRLIIALASLKRRVEALQVYQRFANVLQREYKAIPSEETQTFYEAVRRGGELSPHFAPITNPPGNTQSQEDRAALLDQVGRHAPVETIGRTHQSPIVGRDAELEAMRTILLQVEQGVRLQVAGQRKSSGIPLDTQRHPQCLMLMGDAGIGKTRLAEEMSREARQRGWAVVWSRLYTQESSVPYRVWIEALRKTLPLGSRALPDLEPATLQAMAALLPELREALPPSLLERAGTPHGQTPEQEQLRLRDAIGDWLKLISENTPLLIVLDDIQWADSSSYGLFGHLARLLYGYPVMFVATCRDSELSRRPLHPLLDLVNHMQRERAITTRHIDPLTTEQIGMLVTSVSQLPEVTIQNIQNQAAGNPFFAEELARSTPPTLPRTVVAALDIRINRLSEACRQLLKNAAVLGGTFEFTQICAMESGFDESDAANLADEDAMLTLLEEALQAGVLTDEGAGTQILYHFWHPLLVSRLYEQISAIRRARLHRRAADMLERIYRNREEEAAAIITGHLLKGDARPERIAHYAEMAGNRAYAVFAYPEAEQHYRLAVEQLEQLRTRDLAHQASLLGRLAECVMILGHFTEARHFYERVLTLREQLVTPGTTLQQDTREIQLRALVLVEIGWMWMYIGNYPQAWERCIQTRDLLSTAQLVNGPGWARLYHLQGMLHRQEGHYEEALQQVQQAITLYEQQLAQQKQTPEPARELYASRILRTLEGDPVNLGRAHRLMAAIAAPMGQFSRVLEHQSKALALCEQYNEQRQIGHLTVDIGYTRIKKGEYELAEVALQRALNLAQRVGDNPLLLLVHANLGELAAANGNLDQAEQYYKQALNLAETRLQDRDYISRWNSGLAAILQAQGKLDEAAICVKRAWDSARAIASTPCLGLALVALGSLRIAQVIVLEKSRSGQQAISTKQVEQKRLLQRAYENLQRVLAAGRQVDVETITRSRLNLAHISFLQGKREEAQIQLQQVLTDAEEYELAQVVTRAQQLQEQVNG